MATRVFDFLTAIDRILSSVRNTLELEMTRGNGRILGLNSRYEHLQELYLDFERARLQFRSLIGDSRLSKREYANREALDFLTFELRRVLKRIRFDDFSRARMLRPTPLSRIPKSPDLHPGLFKRNLSVEEAIEFLIETIENTPRFDLFDDPIVRTNAVEFDADVIRKVVPKEQNVGPLQFEITDNKLEVLHRAAAPLAEDRANAASARSSLVENGSKIIGELERSNCDRRLLENFRDLQQQLESETDIIKLGLANIGAEMMADTFCQELPDAVLSMVRSQNLGISMYVSQFIDWQRFSEKAALVKLSEEGIRTIRQTASDIVAKLVAEPALSDPEVPKTLKALNALIADPSKASKRAAYAVWRSIENLVIKIFNYGTDFFDQTIQKTVDKGSTATAKAAVAALMGLAMAGAVSLTPIAGELPNAGWIKKAVEVVKKQIENID